MITNLITLALAATISTRLETNIITGDNHRGCSARNTSTEVSPGMWATPFVQPKRDIQFSKYDQHHVDKPRLGTTLTSLVVFMVAAPSGGGLFHSENLKFLAL